MAVGVRAYLLLVFHSREYRWRLSHSLDGRVERGLTLEGALSQLLIWYILKGGLLLLLNYAKSHVRLLLVVLSLESRVFIHKVMKLDSLINRHAFCS